jgi:hypothetical protein
MDVKNERSVGVSVFYMYVAYVLFIFYWYYLRVSYGRNVELWASCNCGEDIQMQMNFHSERTGIRAVPGCPVDVHTRMTVHATEPYNTSFHDEG